MPKRSNTGRDEKIELRIERVRKEQVKACAHADGTSVAAWLDALIERELKQRRQSKPLTPKSPP